MAWRFKASKYKNAAPIVPKFEDLIRDLSIGSYRSHGNFIAASASFMALNWDTQGSNLAVLPLDTKGRVNKASVPLIYAHSDFVTDFQFSPFDDGLLATASQDLTIKLWRVPETGLTASGLNQPELVLPSQPRRVETVNFHPNADCILATTSANSLVVWDLIQAKELYSFQDHDDEVQSVAWQHTGGLLATQCKDRQLRILDPRTKEIAGQCESHQGIKDSKVVWTSGPERRVFTTGFSGDRLREITIRDLRNLSTPQKNMTLDMSAGILVPLYDPDTGMCFLSGKGDRNIQFIEITDKEPYIVEGLKYSGEQTKGACLVPKRAMDVMQGEVNRVLQLCDSSIVPVTWQVPRKTYRDYHADIYPETYGLEPASGPETWWQGYDGLVPKINLDPKKRPKEKLVVYQGPLSERNPNFKTESTNGHVAKNGTPPSSSAQNGASNNHFVKPNPRPRCVVKANVSSSPSGATNGTNNKPQIVPRSNKLSNGASPNEPTNNTKEKDSDTVDEGLAMLRRQPSIRDRKKLFEDHIRKQQGDQNGQPTLPTAKPSVPNREESDKENQKIITEKPKKTIVEAEPITKDSLETEENNTECNNMADDNNSNSSSSNNVVKKNIFLTLDKPKADPEPRQKPAPRPTSKVFVRVSKFRHLKGEVILKGRFENLKNLSRTVPAECNFIQANKDRIAVPLTGPGGKIAVFETRRPGRIPDGVTPVLINGTTVLDFAFDPFDTTRLAAACDDGYIRSWKIPQGGLLQQENEPAVTFPAHGDKIQIVKWHPLAQDLLVTCAFDRTVKLWDLNDANEPKIELEGHEDQIFSLEWSQCGRYVATVCRDGLIRSFAPQQQSTPIIEGGDIVAKKGARVVWVLDGQYLIVTGFSKQSERQIMVYETKTLKLVNNLVLDVSPAILIPFYDEDSNTLFLTGKGESTVTTFEVSAEAPHLFPLSPYRPAGLHQGFAFLPKNVCDTRAVEFARAFRLTASTIEPIAFSVPRVKTAFFQDDLFPDTRVLWEPTLSASEWFGGSAKQARVVSLRPDDMKNLSGAKSTSGSGTASSNMAAAAAGNNTSLGSTSLLQDRDKAKKAAGDLEASVSNLLGKGSASGALEQDRMEGVDEEEWNE